eukprot:scaffold112500_cov63-Phaeocystis_antarctica.AAC.5
MYIQRRGTASLTRRASVGGAPRAAAARRVEAPRAAALRARPFTFMLPHRRAPTPALSSGRATTRSWRWCPCRRSMRG